MKLVLKPLFEVELPPEFVDILKTKIKGREIKEGEIIEIDLLGKPLKFEVIYAEPKEFKVKEDTKIELSSGKELILDFEFDKVIKNVILVERNIVILFEDEVLVLSENGHKIYNEKFEGLKEVRGTKNTLVIVYENGKRIRLIHF
ncbi:DUF6849 domain-containing protein [Thermococcus paralvinellae]|uniref:Cell division protein containing CDC48 domain n=1 Tax=Thermococcus paralvinellae TaxID=582419 RepID=W0I7A4_9EURY|nr:ATPase [Thermococcus paralvinellae]AHF80617.1 cell division protein containing CDC48 domain [Thermococcus paralvinellae]